MKSPRKSKGLCGMVSKLHNKTNVTPEKNGNVSKELRKIAVLRSKQRHDKAQDIIEKLKAQYQTVTQIAREACEDKKSIYRLLLPPKQQKKEEYSRKLSNEVKHEVERIYNDDEISYCLPDMKFTGYRFMSCTIHEAHLRYMEKCKTKRKVAEKMFAVLKPKYIKTIQDTPLCGCSCDDCSNSAKSRDTLVALGIKGIPRNHLCCIEKTLCPFRNTSKQCDEMDIRNPVVRHEFPARKCVERKCKDCGLEKYQ